LSILHTLSRRGSCRLSDLVRSEQIKQPALTAAIAKLVRDGLVARERDPSDGRAVLLSLTPAGAALVRGRRSGRVDRLRELVGRLSPDDRSRLLSVASVLDEVVRLARETAPDGEE
jgi:DNA-binding MarR family transcriptional regulator